jgi:hypothetical protein
MSSGYQKDIGYQKTKTFDKVVQKILDFFQNIHHIDFFRHFDFLGKSDIN